MIVRIFRIVRICLQLLSGIVACLLLIAFAVIGMRELAMSAWGFLAEEGTKVENLGRALSGLELLFLAPLPYLVVICMFRYIQSFHLVEGSQASDALRAMHEAKSQIVSLMIAVAATDMIHKILGDGDLSSWKSAWALGLILVLTLYLWVTKH